MDITKFIPLNDKSILDRLETEGQPVGQGGYEDYLKLEPTEEYKNNKERLARIEKEKKEWENISSSR